VAEGILDTAEKVIGGLAIHGLAVGHARVRQHDAEDMGSAALALRCHDRGASAEVDLGLITRLTLEAPEGKLLHGLQAADEAPDCVVAALEAVFGREILVDALRAQTLIAFGLDDTSPELALTRATAGSAATITDRTEQRGICFWRGLKAIRAGGRIGWFWLDINIDRAGGRIGWFWRRPGLLEVACDGLAVDLELTRDSTLGPAPAMKGQDEVYHGHFEQIRHGAAPGKEGFPWSLTVESAAPQSGWFSSALRWLVLSAPCQAEIGRSARDRLTSTQWYRNQFTIC
jgi:hypothetical protein